MTPYNYWKYLVIAYLVVVITIVMLQHMPHLWGVVA